MAVADDDNKPHAVLIPFPAQGHMKALLKVAKLLHQRGFYITFVNTEFNQNRLIKARSDSAGSSHSLSSLPNFKFRTIPDGLPLSLPNATQDVGLLCGSIRRNFLAQFRKLVSQLNESDTNPRVTCIVSDVVMPFTITAAGELGIPVALFSTFAACGFMGFH